MTSEKIGYGKATKIIAALRLIDKYLHLFDDRAVNLDQFHADLNVCLNDVLRYRNYIKLKAYGRLLTVSSLKQLSSCRSLPSTES